MGFIGGDITEASCKHPTLGDYRFEAKSNEAFTLDKGGIRNDDSADGVTGAGNVILKKTRVRWSVEGPLAVDLLNDVEISGLNDLAESADPGVWTFTQIGGAVFTGLGWPVGDLSADTNTSQLKLKVAGGGKLQEIA